MFESSQCRPASPKAAPSENRISFLFSCLSRRLGGSVPAFALLGVLAGSVPSPAHARAPLGFDDARHLLNRTSFAASPADIEAFAGLTREQAVDRLLSWTGKPAVTPPPAWADEPFESLRRFRGMSAEERKLAHARDVPEGLRAAVVVAHRDAGDALAAHREDDAVLAQPLRVQPAEGALAAADVPPERSCCGATRSAISASCCTRSRATRRW